MDGLQIRPPFSRWIPVVCSAVLVLGACSAPRYDGATLEGKKAVIDAVDLALTHEDCATAISTIEGLYGSADTDNEVRIARATAQGCAAGASSTIKLMMDLQSNSAALMGNGFWEVLTRLFSESKTEVLDSRIAAGNNATDALMAALKVGSVVAPTYQVNRETFNVGSILAGDRIDDANIYLIFVSMAIAGGLQNRYGAPTADFKRSQILGQDALNPKGWTLYNNIGEDACAYASSLINMIDAINEVSNRVEGSYGKVLAQIGESFSTVIDLSCDAGCRGEVIPFSLDGGATTTVIDFSAIGCGAAVGFDHDHQCKGTTQRPCMTALRDRRVCTTDPSSEMSTRARCAAAGIALTVSTNGPGWSSP